MHILDGRPTCGSDDFMRHLTGVGVEYGTEWIIDHIIETKLEPVDGEEMFEELLDECYPEISIGCCTFSPSQVMKELDPVCFSIGTQENLDGLAQDGQPLRTQRRLLPPRRHRRNDRHPRSGINHSGTGDSCRRCLTYMT